jgi:hypothetical protein
LTVFCSGDEPGYEVLNRRRITGIPRARPMVLAATMIPPGNLLSIHLILAERVRPAIRDKPSRNAKKDA